MSQPAFIIVQNSTTVWNNQAPFQNPCIVSKLAVGDFSIKELENQIAVKYMTFDDLILTAIDPAMLSSFESELLEGQDLPAFSLVVDCSEYHGFLKPKQAPEQCRKALGRIAEWSSSFGPFIFTGVNQRATAVIEELLSRYAQDQVLAIQDMKMAVVEYHAGIDGRSVARQESTRKAE